MTVQINTDKNISGSDKFRTKLISLVEDELSRFSSKITRVIVSLSDENSVKSGVNDKRCMIEARLVGLKPVAVTKKADTVDLAVDGAIDKLKNSLTKILGRLKDH